MAGSGLNMAVKVDSVSAPKRLATASDVSTAAIAIGADGLAMVSYYDATNQKLKALHCGNLACNSGNISTTLDMPDDAGSGSDDGSYTSIARGGDGLMLISYYSVTWSALKVFHCSNVTCTPYIRAGR